MKKAITPPESLVTVTDRIMTLLRDGKHHTKAEWLACLDSKGTWGTVKVNIFNLKKRLPDGDTIVWLKGSYYLASVIKTKGLKKP